VHFKFWPHFLSIFFGDRQQILLASSLRRTLVLSVLWAAGAKHLFHPELVSGTFIRSSAMKLLPKRKFEMHPSKTPGKVLRNDSGHSSTATALRSKSKVYVSVRP